MPLFPGVSVHRRFTMGVETDEIVIEVRIRRAYLLAVAPPPARLDRNETGPNLPVLSGHSIS